jgi:hypothetical protein
MPQTITSIASLGSRYTAGIQYRLFDGTTLGNLTNGTHLGDGIWRAVVQLPDAGGEVRWFANAGARLLGIDVVSSKPDDAAILAAIQLLPTEAEISAAVWAYVTRTLTTASGLTTEQNTRLNELWRKAQFDNSNPVTRTRNPSTGAVTETIGQGGPQIVHVVTNDGNTVTSTRQP